MASLWRIDSVGYGPKEEQIVNVYYYDQADMGIVDPVDVATAFDAVVTAAKLDCVTAAYTHSYTRALCEAGENLFADGSSDLYTGVHGDASGESDNIWNSVIVRKLSAYSGRNGRGRNFIGPVPKSVIDIDGEVTLPGEFATLATAQLTALPIVALESTVNLRMLVTRTLWETAKKLLIEITFNLIAGIQRRRREKSGP